MKKWTTLQSTYIHKSPFGNIRKDMCELPDGEIISEYYVNEYTDWVNAIVITKENKIVLVKQYRHAAEAFFLEVPAGTPEQNEQYDEAIQREVQEETGFRSDTKPILLGSYYVNPATQTNKVYTYLFVDAYPASQQKLDKTEWIDIHVIDLQKFEGMMKLGKITQLFTASAYYMYKNRDQK